MKVSLVFGLLLIPLAASAQEETQQTEEGQEAEETGGTLRVHIVGLRNDDGYIGCLLYRSAEGFPGDPDQAVQMVVGEYGRRNRRTATCTFRNVPAGRYAVTVGHDENGNRRMDRNLVGIPTEGWGTSRDAPARFGPPSFSDAVFRFNGRRQLMTVTMRYGF
jgi:uncharacterized protein (DUF2141 family)